MPYSVCGWQWEISLDFQLALVINGTSTFSSPHTCILFGYVDFMLKDIVSGSKKCRLFPFVVTQACCNACGNLKAAFLIAVVSK